MTLTILMPCLNEAGTVEACVKKAKRFLETNKIEGEVIVVDNGSMDKSADIAKRTGAKVVEVKERGFGNAVSGGLKEACGEYIILGDADDTYDFYNLIPFLEKLNAGNDLVMGNRFMGEIKAGAMPFLHQYFGNPVITWLGNFLFGFICGDFYCGLRAFKKESILKLKLKEPGIQFDVEMQVRAKLEGLKIAEVPTILYPAISSHRSKVNSWRDGWKTIVLFLRIYLTSICYTKL